MGLDGGTIISRSDVLRGASWNVANNDTSRSTRGGAISSSSSSKPQRVNQSERKKTRLSTCYLTSSELQQPIVCDYLGNLYNKSAVVEYLIGKTGSFESDLSKHRYQNIVRTLGKKISHLRNRKDVFDVTLVTENLKGEDSEKQEGLGNLAFININNMQCPVSQSPFETARVVVLVPCGHIVCKSICDVSKIEASKAGLCPVLNCGKQYKHGTQAVELAPELSSEAYQKALKLVEGRSKGKSSCKRIACNTSTCTLQEASSEPPPKQARESR